MTNPNDRDRGPAEPDELPPAMEFDLPNAGSKIQARRAIYVENTETLVIATMRNAIVTMEAYELWQIGGQWKFTKQDATREVRLVTATDCNCGGFKGLNRCKHADSVRQIEALKNVAANKGRDMFAGEDAKALQRGIDEDQMQYQAEQAEASEFTRAEGEW